MNILIITVPNDKHSMIVKKALESLGHKCSLLITSEILKSANFSFSIDNIAYRDSYCYGKDHINFQDIDTVWCRRIKPPGPPSCIHDEDREMIKIGGQVFLDNVMHSISDNAKWINPSTHSISSESKILQLKIAKEIGLEIPRTYMGNNPKNIKNFIKDHKSNCVLHKCFYPSSWGKEGCTERMHYTSPIVYSDLPKDDVLKATPLIIQERINKKSEVRILYLGGKMVSVKIDSQAHPDGKNDWREIPTNELNLEEIKIPRHLENKCKLLMDKLRIDFGSLDFIVTPEENYVFLEVNEQGQFLWIEAVNPEIKIMQSFIQYILNDPSIRMSLSDFI